MRIFLATLAILIIHCPAFSQSAADVKWFESVFHPVNGRSVEMIIESKQNTRLVAVEGHDPEKEIKTLTEIGALYLTTIKNRESAMQYFIASLEVEDSLRLDHYRIFTFLSIARVFEEVYDFNKSIEYIDQAKALNTEDRDLDIEMLILKESGRIQTKSGNIDEAKSNYELILKYAAQQPEAMPQQADALFSLGRLNIYTNDYQKSLEFHKQALAIQRTLKDRKNEAISLNSFAELYLLMKNPDRAMANLKAVLEIRQGLKDTAGIASAFNRIGEIYLKDDPSRAIDNLQLGLKAALESQNQEEIRKSYDLLSKANKNIRNFEKALSYRESFLSIDDFIRNENSSLQLNDARNRYMLLKKEKEITSLEIGRAQRDEIIRDQANLQKLLFAVIALSLIIAGLIAYNYFAKQKLASKLKEANDAKDKLFSIIGHDIKGPLNSLMSFSSLLKDHGDMITKEEIKMLSTDLDKSLKNLFALLENLLQWARSQTGDMDFTKEEFDITHSMEETKQLLHAQASAKNIKVILHHDQSRQAIGNVNSINTIIRNLLSNAIKFTPANGSITLRAEEEEEHILVSVTDTGVGMSDESLKKLFKVGSKHSTLGTANEKGTGLGLMLCKEFAEKNGGTIGVTSKPGEGSRFYFTVPAK